MKKCLILLLAVVLALSSTGCMSTIALYHMLDTEYSESQTPEPKPEATGKPSKTQAPAPTPTPSAEPTPAAASTPAPGAAFTPAPGAAALPAHTDVSFSDMEYTRPDTGALSEKLKALTADVYSSRDSGTWLARFDEAMALYDDASSQLSLAYLLYAFDVTEDYYQDEYESLELALLEIDVLLADASIAIVESREVGAEAAARWGKDFVDTAYLSRQLNSLEVQDLMEQEVALELEYDELLTTFVYKEGNRTWTLDDLAPAFYAGEIDYEEYFRLYDAYCAALNKEAGALFLELLAIRDEIAAMLGYGSFAAYRYDCYERDFTVDEAKSLHAAVKKYIVPLYVNAATQASMRSGLLTYRTFPLEDYWITLKDVAGDFSPRLAQSLEYMLNNELYDFSVNEKKMEGSFTTDLANYDAPFIFSQWEDTSDNAKTVIHELGHFTHYYYAPSPSWSGGNSLDLAEVDSQGLELLMTHYYDRFFGADAAEAKEGMLVDALYAITSGCMEDEFQQYAYANPDATLEELNEYYYSLAEEYGYAGLYGYTGREWTLVPHSFQSPMYYISYATSMLLSLELWAEGERDFDAARDAYWSILDRGSYERFRAVAARSGLADPILPASVAAIAEALGAELGL